LNRASERLPAEWTASGKSLKSQSSTLDLGVVAAVVAVVVAVAVVAVAAGRPRAFQPNRAKHKSTLTSSSARRQHIAGTPTTQNQNRSPRLALRVKRPAV